MDQESLRAVSCVKVNGILTNVFRLERSVRQGCPLSAMLYALSAEPLAGLLQQNEDVKGVEVPGERKAWCISMLMTPR